MAKNLFYLILFFLPLFTISCTKAKVEPTKVVASTDTIKTVDTSKTTPVTLPAGVATIFASNSNQWLISMHSDGASTSVESNGKNSVCTDAAGNIYMLFNFYGTVDLDPGPGIVASSSYVLDKATLVKYSSAGKLIWSKVFDSDGVVYVDGMRVDQSGNVYCSMFCTYNDTYIRFDGTAHTLKQTNGSNVILKFNTSGTTQWLDEVVCSAYETRGYNNLTGLAVDALGNVYIAGSFTRGLVVYDNATATISASDANNFSAGTQYVIVKCDNNGKYESSKMLFHTGSASPYAPEAYIVVDNNQNIYLSGFIEETNPITGPALIGNIVSESSVIAKYDKNWNWLWLRDDPVNTHHYINMDASGNIYSLGFQISPETSSTQVNKIGSDGGLIWSKTIGTNFSNAPQSLSTANDGSVVVVCDFNTLPNDINLSSHGIVITKYDAGGNLLYSKNLAGYNPLHFASEYGVAFDNSGYLDMIGYFNGSLKYFNNSSDPVYSISDLNCSFFIAHFPDKP